jgi:hypothetical protein
MLYSDRGLRVFWIVAALVLLGILAVTITQRGPVRVAGYVLLTLSLGWALYQRLTVPVENSQLGTRGKSSSPASLSQPVPIADVELSELALTGGGAPFEIRGRIANRNTALQLAAVTLRTTRRDCYADAIDPSGCVVIWQDQHWIRWPVPPGETRDFVATIWAHTPVPRARGTIKDGFELLEATGRPVRTAVADPAQ